MLDTFRGISLRPVTEDDLPFLFRLVTDPGRCHLWMQARRVYDERGFREAWAQWTAGMIGAKFIVERGGESAGLVMDYDHFPEHGFTKVGAMLREEDVGRGYGVVAT